MWLGYRTDTAPYDAPSQGRPPPPYFSGGLNIYSFTGEWEQADLLV
jgi:hypothetical protein